MRKCYYFLAFIYCFSGLIYAQQTEGTGVVTYPNNNIKVVGQKIFWSSNPKADKGNLADILSVHYKGLYNRRNTYLSGIIGSIDKPGGYIKIEVFAYDNAREDGVQLEQIDRESRGQRPVYEVEINQTSLNGYSKEVRDFQYNYINAGILKSYTVSSDDMKTLGSKSLNAFSLNCGGRVWTWLQSIGIGSGTCTQEIDQDLMVYAEDQPVVVKITVKDATLHDVRVPAVANNENLKSRIIEKEYPYMVIKKVNVEVLEAPEDNNTTFFYEDIVRKAFDWTNKVYTARTGKSLSDAAVIAGAKVGNARILFRDIDITIRKGSKQIYSINKINDEGKDDEINLESIDKGELYIKYVSKISNKENTNLIGHSIGRHDNKFAKDLVILSYSRSDDPPHSQRTISPSHELGHYFGLLHTFQGGCNSRKNDRISDTPPAEDLTARPFYEDCIAPLECGGNRRLIENIMDYGNCRFMLTPGQVQVIRNTIKMYFEDLYRVQMLVDNTINTDLNVTIKDLRKVPDAMRSERTVENKPEEFQDIILYPNPVKDVLNSNTLENDDFEIFDFNGQNVLAGRARTGQIDVSVLSKGIYIIKIKGTDHKFVKE